MGEHQKECPKCGRTQIYSKKEGLNRAIKKDCVCVYCANVGRKITKYIDETHNVYGKLTVLGRESTENVTFWLCRCLCGTVVRRMGRALRASKKLEQTPCCDDCRGIGKGESALNAMFRGYVHSARKRKLEFKLSKIDFSSIVEQNCYYCNEKPRVRKPEMNGGCVVNGIDRLDNTVGYIIENCVACCFKCNNAKSTLSQADFLELAEKIHKNTQKRNCRMKKFAENKVVVQKN